MNDAKPSEEQEKNRGRGRKKIMCVNLVYILTEKKAEQVYSLSRDESASRLFAKKAKQSLRKLICFTMYQES